MSQNRQSFFQSLGFRVAIYITLIELVMLTIIGFIYFNSFNTEVERRLRENILLPAQLVNDGVLEYASLAELEQLSVLIGEEIVNSFVIGVNNNIFYSLNGDYTGTAFSDFTETLAEPIKLADITESTILGNSNNDNLIAVAPLLSQDGRTVRFYSFIEISDKATQARRDELLQNYILAIVVTVIVSSLVIFVAFNQIIFSRIRVTLSALQAVTAGALSTRIPIKTKDEIGVLQLNTNIMVARLEELVNTLEKRVADRTRDLKISADVSRQIANILDTSELLTELVKRTATEFGFYQVSIFEYDPLKGELRMVATHGHAGQKMLEDGKLFHVGDVGIVPASARTRQATMTNDVAHGQSHAYNPLLPDTQSELALPILYGGDLLGVLDLQSEIPNRFNQSDIELFSAFADQISTAFGNATLFEQVIEAQQAAEKADRAKSAFLASTSHELRTPLNAIINLTSFVKRGTMGPTTPRQEEILGLVMQSGQSLLALINDVLDMSKIESGSLKLYIESDIDIHPIIKHVIGTVESLLTDKPVTFSVDMPPTLPLLAVDKHRFQQILLNILSNACKFTEKGEIRMKITTDDQNLAVSVKDSGVGISKEDMGKVFEKFVQTESGLRQSGGTGLGMPITKNLVEAHGGQIWLESEFGIGTTFYFTIPLVAQTEAVL
ncbi:MAG: ATP-binding protein [Anaerolineae bacterium]|nr:ATP-binding protein [Anaerolineae bacterium]